MLNTHKSDNQYIISPQDTTEQEKLKASLTTLENNTKNSLQKSQKNKNIIIIKRNYKNIIRNKEQLQNQYYNLEDIIIVKKNEAPSIIDSILDVDISQQMFEDDQEKLENLSFMEDIQQTKLENNKDSILDIDHEVNISTNYLQESFLTNNNNDVNISGMNDISIIQKQENINNKKQYSILEKVQTNKNAETNSNKIKDEGCKCKNSNCLRLHCSCFKNQGYCSDTCKCENCRNQKKYEKAREFVIEKTKQIYKKAFLDKSMEIIVNGGTNNYTKKVKINIDGCNCQKKCQSKYCGCKKLNGVCSPICRCKECSNQKIDLTKEEIRQIYKPCSRKKHKLIFNFTKALRSKSITNEKVNEDILGMSMNQKNYQKKQLESANMNDMINNIVMQEQNIIYKKYRTQKTI